MSSSGPTAQQTEGGAINGLVVVVGTDKFKAVGLAFTITATVITLFRLGERIRLRRLWLDDAWAAFAMVLNIIFLVSNDLTLSDSAQYSQAENIALYYVIVQFFTTTVWASRTSILFTVVRLTSPSSVLRRALMFIFAAFLLIWAILFAQAFWVCESQPGWKSAARPQCNLGDSVAIARVITNLIADALLIIIPSQLVYKVRLSRPQKIRVISIFSASAITTVVCLVHAYYVFIGGGGLRECIAALSETSVSLIVANLSVVVAFLFRIGTEETTAFSPTDLGSIVTIGSLPVLRVQRDPDYLSTVVGVETTTGELGNLSRIASTSKDNSESGSDVETDKPSQPDRLSDV